MIDYKLKANKDGILYDSLMEFKGNPAWRLSNIELAEWEYKNNIIQISIQKGTLVRDLVSPDEKYLVLVFRNNKQFPEPCNCVVYDLEGRVHKVVCCPPMANTEIIAMNAENKAKLGNIMGCGVMNNGRGEEVMAIGIWFEGIARSRYVEPYRESREFDPETGVLGDIISWELPYR